LLLLLRWRQQLTWVITSSGNCDWTLLPPTDNVTGWNATTPTILLLEVVQDLLLVKQEGRLCLHDDKLDRVLGHVHVGVDDEPRNVLVRVTVQALPVHRQQHLTRLHTRSKRRTLRLSYIFCHILIQVAMVTGVTWEIISVLTLTSMTRGSLCCVFEPPSMAMPRMGFVFDTRTLYRTQEDEDV
jgi:hypothetical protein